MTRGFGFDSHRHHQQSRSSNGCPPGIKTIERSGPGIDTIDSSIAAVQQDPACASLLPKKDPDERFNNNFFGQFKGFSITPLHKSNAEPAPTKPAPPPPPGWKVDGSVVPIKTNLKPIQRSIMMRQPAEVQEEETREEELRPPPALPPPNAGSTARPLISSPVLSTTTCTSVELGISEPKLPTRPAPEVPAIPKPTPPPGVKFLPDKRTHERPSSSSSSSSMIENPLTTPTVSSESEKRRGSAEKGSGNSSTLTRIASMLYPISGMVKSQSGEATSATRYNTNSLPRSAHHKANKVMDKDILRSLEISAPIPQKEIEMPSATIPVKPQPVSSPEKKSVVMRAQSMRDSSSSSKPTRPAIHSFGSMRQPSGSRPTSIPASVRPTSPPPTPPVKSSTSESPKKIPGVPGYQNPTAKTTPAPKLPAQDNAYDDCMNLVTDASLGKIMEESPSSDNIYAVIEESVPEKSKAKRAPIESEYKTPKSIEPLAVAAEASANTSASSSSDSMGLLSEIVSEISNRNFESIYSTQTINSESKPKSPADDTYVNSTSSQHYKTPSSVYSNSTTSSGYLHPSAVNVPKSISSKAPEPKTSSSPSSEKVASKPSPTLYKPKLSEKKKEEQLKTTPPKPTASFGRTKTPPSLRVQKPARQSSDASSSRSASRQNSDSSLKSTKTEPSPTKEAAGKMNSPDLVSSCSSSQTKSPDVLGRDNKAKAATKTSTLPRNKGVTMPPKPFNLITKTASFSDSKTKTSPTSGTAKTTTTSPTKPEPTKPVQRAASSKSNVASLQQKFEQPEKSTTGTLTRKKPTATTTTATTTAAKK